MSAVLALAGAALACSPDVPGEAPGPHLLLVTLDTTRADHCSAYGYARDTTPTLRALAAEGLQFAAAYAPSPSTAPSHASIFSGLHPIGHGLLKNTLSLPEDVPTLPARLAEAGYATAAVVSSFVLDQRFGLGRGFEHYDDAFQDGEDTLEIRHWEGIDLAGAFDRRADHTTDRALAWLGRRPPGRPFFLFVHYFDPHLPYDPPEEERARFSRGAAVDRVGAAIDRYDAEIAFTDGQLGRLLEGLEALGLADHTLVVVAGDHGEGLMDHGHMEHGIHLFEEALRVPLLLRWPGRIEAGRLVGEPVGLVDLAPTLYSLLGIEAAPPSQGVDLSGALVAGAETLDPNRPLYLQTDRPRSLRRERPLRGVQWAIGEMFGLRVGPWKYLEDREAGRSALFDLRRDPEERLDRLAAEPEVASRLASELARWKRAQLRPAPPAPELSPSEIEAFRALGYLE